MLKQTLLIYHCQTLLIYHCQVKNALIHLSIQQPSVVALHCISLSLPLVVAADNFLLPDVLTKKAKSHLELIKCCLMGKIQGLEHWEGRQLEIGAQNIVT